MNKLLNLLQNWEKELSKVINMTVFVVLNDGSHLLPKGDTIPFCEEIKKIKSIELSYQWNSLLAIAYFRMNKAPIRFLCPFSLITLAIPIFNEEEELIAVLFAGQRRLIGIGRENTPYLTKKMQTFPNPQFEELYESIPTVDEEHLDKITPLLELFAEEIGKYIETTENTGIEQAIANYISEEELINLIEIQLMTEKQAYFNLDDLEKIFKQKKQVISQLIKIHRGKTFIPYYHQIKVKQANNLLTTTEYTISEISESLGFMDAVRFFKVYKKETGMTPTEYREKHSMKHFLDGSMLG
ncbi:PocR sensory domain-containing protein [Pilibacter termitis]|uniref:PocR sensory domain-containing protein n=1 Tax=Pilibacter termitis TaxID=263852 RepID=A0A1T4QPU0_9ENTE|nr:helix-turn-helix domain-containing protein [Pilibacter termitis]SKA05715.1 PocR sensory domain-containing protein [Pilibacter termitis]